MELEQIKNILNNINYKNWWFEIKEIQNDFGYLIRTCFMAKDADSDIIEKQECRWFFLNFNATETEIVRTAFKAIETAEYHELCESFFYLYKRIYHPHLDLHKMADFMNTNPIDEK
jgi:hypothetical protein